MERASGERKDGDDEVSAEACSSFTWERQGLGESGFEREGFGEREGGSEREREGLGERVHESERQGVGERKRGGRCGGMLLIDLVRRLGFSFELSGAPFGV